MVKVLILLLGFTLFVTLIRKIVVELKRGKYNRDKYNVRSLTDTQLRFMIGSKKTIFCCDLMSDFYFILVPYKAKNEEIKDDNYYLMIEKNNMSLTKCDDLYLTLDKIRKDLTSLRFYSTENFSKLYNHYRGLNYVE